jgi:hydroxyacylglutathione hydrolase
MFLRSFPSGPFDTNAYVIGCRATKQAVIIDPSADSLPLLSSYLSENHLAPTAILLTHSHWDHIADLAATVLTYNIPVYVHELDAPNVRNPGCDKLPCWLTIAPVEPNGLLAEGQVIKIGQLEWQIIHTPGHSPGSICLYCPAQKTLISGDTLFKGTYGNTSLPTANPLLMRKSLQRLASLPTETAVYPGHGPQTTISNELSWLKEI